MNNQLVIPLQPLCLGCKQSFLLGQKLPLQSMTIQFKNYSFPIKASQLKQILLKTIVAFMNSKGGTIYLGVNDLSGQVVGVRMQRKEMDQFRLMIKHMLQKVQPKVDLIKSQQVSVEFIPILEEQQNHFYGKYIVKIVVLQGDLSKLYCISEKISPYPKGSEKIEVISSFRRHNLGGMQEIKGIKVIHEIYEKAINPHNAAKTFHQNCNPKPISPQLLQRQKSEGQKQIQWQNSPAKSKKESNSNPPSQISQDQTIINKLQFIQNKIIQEDIFRVQHDEPHSVIFQNIKPEFIKSLANFLKNSTYAKYGQVQMQGINIKVVFVNNSLQSTFLDQIKNSKIKRLINDFGNNQEVFVRISSIKNIEIRKTFEEKNFQQQLTGNFIIKFSDYLTQYQDSLQNYLQKCMSTNIYRKMRKTKHKSIELQFRQKDDMIAFYQMCKKIPHSIQLSRFGPDDTIKIKIKSKSSKSKNLDNDMNNKKQKQRQEKIQVMLNPPPYKQNNIPNFKTDLLKNINEIKIQPQNIFDNESLELVASSLQPQFIDRLSNYFSYNMFFNIKKKIYGSKLKFYLRLVFDNTNDCRRFLQYCSQQIHFKLLAQFSATKTLKIGVPGQSLLIYPFLEDNKEHVKNIIMKVLGKGVVRASSQKQVGQNKYWVLSLVNKNLLLQYYEKLEQLFRRQTFTFGNRNVNLNVFLEYKVLNK